MASLHEEVAENVAYRTPEAQAMADLVAKQVKATSKRGNVDEQELSDRIGEIEEETQILGTDYIKLHIIDPGWTLQNSGFIDVDGQGFFDTIELEFPQGSKRYWIFCAVEGSTDVAEANFIMTFQDKLFVDLRNEWGVKVAPPGTQTRAQFVHDLLVEAGVPAVIPGINILQPVEEEKKGEAGEAVIETAVSKNQKHAEINKSADTGKMVRAQYEFAAEVAALTGLDARVVCAWCLAEQSGTAAKGRENESNNNWLDIGYFDSGPGQIAFDSAFKNPKTGAVQTAKFLKGEWGGASPGILRILKSIGSGPSAEITAIANSGFASSGYDGGQTLRTLYGEIGKAETPSVSGGETVEAKSDVGQLKRGTDGNPDEDSGECVKRLAQQVDWFAFSDGHRFYYMTGPELAKQKPALKVDIPNNHVITRASVSEYGVITSPTTYTLDQALALDTPIPTPDGWTTMGHLRKGQMVLGSDGRPVVVLRASRVFQGHDCYRVRFSDGSEIIADAGHLWETRTVRPDVARALNGDRRLGWYTTEEIAHSLYAYDKPPNPARHNHRIKVAQPLELPERELPIDPYVFGYWLGDGASRGPSLTVCDEDKASLLAQIEGAGYSHKARLHPSTGYGTGSYWYVGACLHATYRKGSRWADNLTRRLNDLGVLDNKHVPVVYLRASLDQRVALLQGLMDSDGTVGKDCCLALSDERLAEDAWELIHTLGFRVNQRVMPPHGRNLKTQYRMTFSARGHVNPFRLPRKANRYAERAELSMRRSAHRTIIAVDPIASEPTKCIAVDAPDKLFLAGHAMIPTRNTAFEYRLTHKVKTRTQRRSRAVKPTSPSEVKLDLICDIGQYVSGEVILFQNSGVVSSVGRWIIVQTTRKCMKDIFTEILCEPPVEPLPEPKESSKEEVAAGEGGESTAGGATAQAQKALSERSKYVYSEGANRGNNGTLFGPEPRTMDCSSFCTLAYKAAGLPDPSNQNYSPIGDTASMIANCEKVSVPTKDCLCFFGPSESETVHVTLYVGGGKAIAMQAPGITLGEGDASTFGPGNFIGYYKPKNY